MNLPERKKNPLNLPKTIPDSEADRVAEAMGLLSKLTEESIPKLTTWEVEMIDSIRSGRAVTRIRLKELREAIHRLFPDTQI